MCRPSRSALYSLHSRLWYSLYIIVTDPVHTFVHFPDLSDVEAYTDARPPCPSHQSPLTSYSNACWGSQIDSAVCDGTLLPLLKCRSMSGGIIFCQGRPIAWTAVRQERTSLSLCKAEIRVTNEVSKLLMGICLLVNMFGQMVTTLSTRQRLPLFIMTMNRASSGLTT